MCETGYMMGEVHDRGAIGGRTGGMTGVCDGRCVYKGICMVCGAKELEGAYGSALECVDRDWGGGEYKILDGLEQNAQQIHTAVPEKDVVP